MNTESGQFSRGNESKGGTKGYWSFCNFNSDLYKILNYFQRMNKTYFVFAWLESNLRVLKAWHFFERGDPVVWLDWHVPGAPGQHTLSCT